MSYHRRRYHHRQESSWQSLPAWEKQFCVKVGAMSWKRFVQAKKNLYKTDKVYDWNDSAGLKAFNEAKQRFWAEFHGFPCKKSLPSADMYTDKDIDWSPKIDEELFSEIKALSDDDQEEVVVAKEIDWFSIPLDQIKPTGWDEVWDYGPQLPKIVGY
ncbi:hypothetical protein REPUB_Repub07fG0219900 [Reevesia pubescens]